uniref:NADH-ubiquinone oxidoreductase chain 2 n=1 Tax=Semibalanus balanoides TaxID=94630 RepID=A0A3G1V8R8_SEMBA|nr:NADH dehydrogenase subunit 2 [Semibalanus balanoides]AYJ83648.1 NADH dehydrogenase subunit 2 [Semibalanus balanoides]AYJ83661.1 NADH dehydrogenase subunit 2 [Semibalanus balanoides]AYJ83674.1 NADH dehydrogenase subunit 2 [Semibalanus balanoides]
MNLYFPPFIYSFFLFSGTLISISSSSLFGMWMGLEINLMSFIPMIINLDNNKKSSEAAIKYFLIQAMASALVIFSSLYFYLLNSHTLSSTSNILITLALCMKLGMAPFHFWFPEVLEGLNWVNSLLLLTWQKISPLVILSLFFYANTLLALALTSALVGAISGINQTSMRKILAFSSISHLGWMGSMMFFNSSLWMDYFFIYCFTSFILCFSFWLLNLSYFSQLTLLQNMDQKFMVFINMLSLGGLPPLLGFLPKWIAMMVISSNFPVLIILMSSSLITLYFYTRLCFSTFTLYLQSMVWSQKNKGMKNFYILSILSLFSLGGIIPFSLIYL